MAYNRYRQEYEQLLVKEKFGRPTPTMVQSKDKALSIKYHDSVKLYMQGSIIGRCVTVAPALKTKVHSKEQKLKMSNEFKFLGSIATGFLLLSVSSFILAIKNSEVNNSETLSIMFVIVLMASIVGLPILKLRANFNDKYN